MVGVLRGVKRGAAATEGAEGDVRVRRTATAKSGSFAARNDAQNIAVDRDANFAVQYVRERALRTIDVDGLPVDVDFHAGGQIDRFFCYA